MKNITFTVTEREITRNMEGDREEEHGWDRDPDEVGEFSTLAEAKAKVAEWAKTDKVEVASAGRYGIGSITRPVYEIEAWYEDENGETVYCDENGEPADDTAEIVDVLDLHPDIEQAWDKAKREYYGFLDYERDDFGSVKSALEE